MPRLVHVVGERSVLAELADEGAAAVHALAAQVRRQAPEGCLEEVVPGACTLLVVLRTAAAGRTAEIADLLRRAPLDPAGRQGGREVEVPVAYDGPDLDDVAARTGLTRPQVVAAHSGVTYTVAFLGFSPGFAFCGPLPDALDLPRRDSPRTRVPAGSLAMAHGFTAVYPTPTPGGWHLIGRAVGEPMWDLRRDPVSLLAPGDRVRFTGAGR